MAETRISCSSNSQRVCSGIKCKTIAMKHDEQTVINAENPQHENDRRYRNSWTGSLTVMGTEMLELHAVPWCSVMRGRAVTSLARPGQWPAQPSLCAQ